jgi:hypothetical protein
MARESYFSTQKLSNNKSEIPCQVSSDPHEWHNGLEHCLHEVLGEIPIAVKMPFTHRKTERPREALLKSDIVSAAFMRSIRGSL